MASCLVMISEKRIFVVAIFRRCDFAEYVLSFRVLYSKALLTKQWTVNPVRESSAVVHWLLSILLDAISSAVWIILHRDRFSWTSLLL